MMDQRIHVVRQDEDRFGRPTLSLLLPPNDRTESQG